MRLPVLDRYLARELVSPFVFGGSLFTFFLLIDRIYHLTDLVITKGVPFYLVVQLLVFMLPSFLAHTLPMALLVAVLLAGGRLAGDLEIVAFKSAGVSVLRLFRPVLLAALAVAGTTALLTLVANPFANREFQRQLFKILQSRAVSGLQERVFNTTFGDVIIYVEEVSASQVALRGLLVSDERNPKLSRIITSREGRLLTDDVNRRITLRMLNGAVNEADVMPADPPKAVLTDVAPPGGAASAARYRHTLFSIYDMSLSVDSPLKGAPRIEKPEKDLPLGELEARIVELRADPHGRAPYLIEWHKRYALPFAALVFALVAFPLAIRSHRGGRSIALAASLGILLAYYVLMTSLEGVALRLTVAPWLAIWAPNTIFALAGAILLAATAREWRLPAMPALWRALGRLQRRAPAPRVSAVRAHAPGTARDSTHIIDRYLVREFVTFMAVGLAVAAALFVVIDLLQTLDRYLRVKPPLLYILEHFAYRLPPALHDGLPVIMLVATIFLFLTLSRYHELTAMKAAGLSLYRVSLPILGIGVVVAAAAGLFQELVLPGLNEHGDEVDRVKIRGQAPRHLQSRQRLWVRSSDTRFYRIELLHPGTNDMYGVTILEVDKDFRLTDRLDARRAHWTPAGWEFSEGALREVRPDGQVQTVPFVWTALDIKEEMEDFIRIQKPITSMSYRELKEYIGQLEAAGFQARKYLVELYSKLSFPLVNLVMVLVAIPFALQSPRHGRLFGVGLAVAIMAGYLVVHYVALAFARADLLPPLLAAWTANVIFLGIGVSLLLRART
ncbi:MAG TPA: LPS export ABC transporter permease LptG [Methylomirabilota bacterium]|nr:LPS export ABC transporter permease LptG [Methylomirabilota bacterium]